MLWTHKKLRKFGKQWVKAWKLLQVLKI
ncbi:KxYKxGKxW signal peptide domain-containing protein [Lactobacillus crispatus]